MFSPIKQSLHRLSEQFDALTVQMHCSLDSGLVVVVFIISCLLWVVGLLLFYDFGNICDKAAAKTNDSTSVVMKTLQKINVCKKKRLKTIQTKQTFQSLL